MVYSGKGKIMTIIYGKLDFLLHFHCFVMSYFTKASDYAERDFHEKSEKVAKPPPIKASVKLADTLDQLGK